MARSHDACDHANVAPVNGHVARLAATIKAGAVGAALGGCGSREIARTAEPVTWAIWRPELVSNFRSLEPDETVLLDALVEGRTFPELCEAVAAFTGDDEAPARAAGLLRSIVEGGMIAGFAH